MTLADGDHAPKTSQAWLDMGDAINDSLIEAEDEGEPDQHYGFPDRPAESPVCPYCGMTTWLDGHCALPGCEGYAGHPEVEDDGEGVLADDQMARLIALLQVCKMAGTTGPFRYRSSQELIRLSHWVMTGDPHMVEAEG